MEDGFGAKLKGIELSTLENSPHAAFGLNQDLQLVYFNPAWFTFSRENGGDPDILERFGIGTPIEAAIVGPLTTYYRELYRHVIRTGDTWSHHYECSSPEVFRMYHETVYPLLDHQGLVVVNSLVEERPHDPVKRAPMQGHTAVYTQESGTVTQCVHCRRTQRSREPALWDWVPEWVKTMPPNISFALCPFCHQYYYNKPAEQGRERQTHG
jgi:hypothetical protein